MNPTKSTARLIFCCFENLFHMRIINVNMAEKFYKNEKFQKFFYGFLYFLMTIGCVFTFCFVFVRSYYTNVYISGSSMTPTLLGGTGGKWYYGISDNHSSTVDNIKRFDVALTYYPSAWNAGDEDTVYKIKRVWGLPGETITLSKTTTEYTFTVKEGDEIKYSITAPIIKKYYDFAHDNMTVAEFKTDKKTFYTNAKNDRVFTITLDKEKQESENPF